MASNVQNWDEILKDRYATFKIEENAFVDSLQICNSTEVAALKIYETIRGESDIPENLKIIYHEAVHGSNDRVKLRIRNRIANIRRNYR